MTSPGPSFDACQVTLADGRRMEVFLSGPTIGRALLLHHGTPGCGRPLVLFDDAARRHGLRMISISRPGYGTSDRSPGRSVVDAAADSFAVLDRLGIDECLVAGWSGGGPLALACGAARPSRVRAIAVMAGPAPFPAEGLDWFADMEDSEAALARAALAGEEPLRSAIRGQSRFLQTMTADQLRTPAPWRGPADRAALDRMADDMVANFRAALAGGVDGWVDDYLMFLRPWGFDVADLAVPTTLWQGSQDRLNPPGHMAWLAARIPGARLHVEVADGHVSIVADHLDRILADLQASPPA